MLFGLASLRCLSLELDYCDLGPQNIPEINNKFVYIRTSAAIDISIKGGLIPSPEFPTVME